MTRIIHFSDPHEFGVLQGFSALFDKRLFGFATSFFIRRKQHKPKLLDDAIAEIIRLKPDVVVFTGDAVSTGSPLEFKRALPHYMPLVKSGIPLICTAGNHDCYIKRNQSHMAMQNFYQAIADGRKNVFSEHPFTREIGDLRFVVLPESRPTPVWLSCGYLNEESLEYVLAECAKKDERPIVLVGHFPVLQNSYRRGLRNSQKIRDLLKSGKIALSLCGHVHPPRETLDAAGYGEIIAGSITKFGSMPQITYNPETKTFQTRRVQLPLTH